MIDSNDLARQFVTLINNSIAHANKKDFVLSFGKMREAEEFASAHSLEHLWSTDAIHDVVCDYCSRLTTTLIDEGSDDVALELLIWEQRIYPNDFYLQYNLGRLAARRSDLAGTILHYEAAMDLADAIELPLNHLSILVCSLAGAYQRTSETSRAITFVENEIKKRDWPANAKKTLDEILAYLKGDATDIKIVSGREQARDKAHQLIDYANKLDEAGKFTEAQPLYEKAMRLAPDNPNIFYDYGVACAQQKDEILQEKALELYREAIRLDPNYQNAYANLAPLLLYKGDFAEAAKNARKAIELGMEAYTLYVVLGFACTNIGAFDEARAAYNKALTLAEPHYRHAIEEYIAKLPLEDSRQPGRSAPGAVVSRGATPPPAKEHPLRQISADTFPRLGRQFAEAMGKKFVHAGYGVFNDRDWTVFFTCHDGEYKAVMDDEIIRIYLMKDGKESEVFTIKRA